MRAAHLDPLCSRLGAGGLGRSSPQPISNWLTEVGGMHGRRGSGLPLRAAVSGEEDWDPGTPEEDQAGSGLPRLHPRGGAWWGWDLLLLRRLLPTPGLVLGSPPGLSSPPPLVPSPVLSVHLRPGLCTRGRRGRGGCGSGDAHGPAACWTRGAEPAAPERALTLGEASGDSP